MLCALRKGWPDGLFTLNKMIPEEMVVSQRNFLASSAILASKLTRAAGGFLEERRRTLGQEGEAGSQSLGRSSTRAALQATHLGSIPAASPPVTLGEQPGLWFSPRAMNTTWCHERLEDHRAGCKNSSET